MISLTNPWTQELIAQVDYSSSENLELGLSRLHQNSKAWALSNKRTRAEFLRKLAVQMQKNSMPWALGMAEEMGKPLTQGLAEIEKSARCCLYYADQAEQEMEQKATSELYSIRSEAQGVIFAIMPWNFPLWQIVRFLAPGLALGNSFLIKPADLTIPSGLRLQKALATVAQDMDLAGSPAAVMALDHNQSAKVIQDNRIRGVTFTGSVSGGRVVATAAAMALKKSVLELGGSDPYLVFQDADVQRAAQICAVSRLQNAGQSCVAAKRFFIHASRYDEFLIQFKAEIAKLKVGDPTSSGTELGPLASAGFAGHLTKQVLEISERWKCVPETIQLDQAPGDAPVAFYSPQVLQMGNAEDFTSRWDIELFGPVACIWKFTDEEKALECANHSDFGLGAALFTRDLEKAERFAATLDCGLVAINDMVKSDPRWSFGGVKNSGYGRELGSQAMLEFANLKSIVRGKLQS
jgi:succinate-semialdehyde dehydrogenase/glutarate-semialdehyde dehydrogenase